MPKLAPADKDVRRSRILDAALRCFARKGFHLTTVDEIAAEAGVSKGTPYVYFESKLDLFVALHARWDCGLEARVQQAVAGIDPRRRSSPRCVLEAVVAAVGDHVQEEADLCRVLLEARTQGVYLPPIAEQVRTGMERAQASIASLVRAGMEAGEVPPTADVELRARLVVATINGLMAEWHLNPGGFSWHEAAGEIADRYLGG
jgi:AcrR family transcriptional regulator